MMERLRQLLQVRWSIALVALAISIAGVVNLESAARTTFPGLHLTQAWWIGAGLLAALLLAALDYRHTRRLAYPLYALVCGLLALVLVKGTAVKGSLRWLDLGPVNMQPSELMKIAIIILLARYLAGRESREPYSLAGLTRPLNVSRPLALIAAVLAFWDRPLLASPLGVLASWLRATYNGVPPALEAGWAFRVALLAVLALGYALFVWLRLRLARAEILEPGSGGGAGRWVLLGGLLAGGLAVLLAWHWHAPALSDPVNAVIRALILATEPGGRYAPLVAGGPLAGAGYGVRAGLLGLGALWLAVSVLALRLRGLGGMDDVIAPLDWLLVPAALILIEPDLGTTLILLAIGGVMILFVGVRRQSLAILLVTMLLGGAVAWAGVLRDYQKRRILTFLDPEADAKGAGYHALQSLIAVGSGRVWGKGHGAGTQTQLRFLPEQHTDFAFSVWAEEKGFVGALALLLLYLLLLWLLLATAASAPDEYGTLLAVGVTALIFWHLLVNVGMVIGLLPVVGVTLPLFSYGGSSALTIWVALGVALSVSVPSRTFTERL